MPSGDCLDLVFLVGARGFSTSLPMSLGSLLFSCNNNSPAGYALKHKVLGGYRPAKGCGFLGHTKTICSGFVANSKYKIPALFKDPNCIFQAPKLSTKSHVLDADIQNLDCNEILKCTEFTNTIMIKASK